VNKNIDSKLGFVTLKSQAMNVRPERTRDIEDEPQRWHEMTANNKPVRICLFFTTLEVDTKRIQYLLFDLMYMHIFILYLML
jgi:hypothetical protein